MYQTVQVQRKRQWSKDIKERNKAYKYVREKFYSQCKGPEAGLCLVLLRNSEEAGVAGAE